MSREPDWDAALPDPADDTREVECPGCGGSGDVWRVSARSSRYGDSQACGKCDGSGLLRVHEDGEDFL